MIPAQTIAQMGKSSLKEKTNMMKALPMMSLLGGGGMGQGFTGAGGGASAMSAPSFSSPSNPGAGFSTSPGASLTPPGSFDLTPQPWEPPSQPVDLGSGLGGGIGGGSPTQGFFPPQDLFTPPVTDLTAPGIADTVLGGGQMPDTSWLNLFNPDELADVVNNSAN